MIFSEITFLVTIFLDQYIVIVDIIATNLIILLLGIGGLKHDELLLELRIYSNLENNPALNSESKISEEEQKQIVSEIKEIIKSEKLHLNPNLKLSNFARKLHITERELSIIINDTISAGYHKVEFGTSKVFNLTSGVYIYILSAKNFRSIKKMILLK